MDYDELDLDALDELVHDVKSQEASDINNSGKEAQVKFLLESGYTEAQLLAQCARETTD